VAPTVGRCGVQLERVQHTVAWVSSGGVRSLVWLGRGMRRGKKSTGLMRCVKARGTGLARGKRSKHYSFYFSILLN
jgi:hypothetical protein